MANGNGENMHNDKDLDGIVWLKECELCNVGVVKEIDELRARGLSIRAASEQMERDCGELHSAENIRARYKYYKGPAERKGRTVKAIERKERYGVDAEYWAARGVSPATIALMEQCRKALDDKNYKAYFLLEMITDNAINSDRGLPPIWSVPPSVEGDAEIFRQWYIYYQKNPDKAPEWHDPNDPPVSNTGDSYSYTTWYWRNNRRINDNAKPAWIAAQMADEPEATKAAAPTAISDKDIQRIKSKLKN